MNKKILAALLAGSVSLSAMAGSMKSDIVETAAEAGTFKTLLAAAEAAGLVGTL